MDFKLSLEIRIDWSDLDMYEHVNNISIMQYLQSGRVNFWEATGIHEYYKKANISTMLVSSKCDFKKALSYPGTAVVKSATDFIGNSSFGLAHNIFNDHGELCADSRDVVVWYDFNDKKTRPIPEWLRDKLNEH
ncbi:thioesterase [Christiangramia salexigens]|uniref:Thioesterase n=1 Tax=Christiangramia salexigens TaxID=1913577 RepID=A0A1L3J8N3_9FLAO|nr:thioesterase [Christiangramia salexigens]